MFMPQPVLKKYYDALEEGKLLGIKCKTCGYIEYPPMPTCNECGHFDMEWIELSGEAIVRDLRYIPKYDVRYYGDAQFNQIWPYGCGIGELKEGTPFTGMILGVTQENEAEYQAKLPLTVKMETIQLDGFKTVAWRIVE